MEFTKKDLNKTLWVKPAVIDAKRSWYHIDASGKTLGRLATKIARVLAGKNKGYMCDFWDCGDFVIVTNAGKINVTGDKLSTKNYHTYSGYKGNVKTASLGELLSKNPQKVLWLAVRGMLAKNKLRDKRMKRLKLFTADTHTYKNLSILPLNHGN